MGVTIIRQHPAPRAWTLPVSYPCVCSIYVLNNENRMQTSAGGKWETNILIGVALRIVELFINLNYKLYINLNYA